MEVSGQPTPHPGHSISRKQPQYPFRKWVPGLVYSFWRREKSLFASARIPAHCLDAILMMPSWLTFKQLQ